MPCLVCKDVGTVDKVFKTIVGDIMMRIACSCSAGDIWRDKGKFVKTKTTNKTKTTHIPQKEYYDPETGEVKYYSYDDEITDTTIEEYLK